MHKPTKLERQQHRLKQIHKMIILGLTLEEMAERIGCNERTVRRDLDADYERLERDGHREVAANRAAILAELGRTYAEALKDYERAKAADRETWGYLNSRIRALALMARISGAEMPSRLIIQGQLGVKHTLDPSVQMVSEAELLKMAQIAAEVAGQAKRQDSGRAATGSETGTTTAIITDREHDSEQGHPRSLMQVELPFSAGIITVTLTTEQRDQLAPLVRRQVVDRRGLLFCSVAPFWHAQEGETKLAPSKRPFSIIKPPLKCSSLSARRALCESNYLFGFS